MFITQRLRETAECFQMFKLLNTAVKMICNVMRPVNASVSVFLKIIFTA